MAKNLKHTMQLLRTELASLQSKPSNGTKEEQRKLIAAMFGQDTADRLFSSKASIGYKASGEMSEQLYTAIADELGEAVAVRIQKMLSSDNETVMASSEQGIGVGPRKKEADPWAFAKSVEKPRPSPIVSQYTDSFWKSFLKRE